MLSKCLINIYLTGLDNPEGCQNVLFWMNNVLRPRRRIGLSTGAMADCAIILYLECLIGLIYHFKKLGQRDLNKKINIKICKKRILDFF